MQKIYKKLNILLFIIIVIFPAYTFACENDEISTVFGCIPKGKDGLKNLIGEFFAWTAGIIGSLAMLGLIYAGYVYITSAGNPDSISKAKDIIITSITSVLIIIFSYALFKILGIA